MRGVSSTSLAGKGQKESEWESDELSAVEVKISFEWLERKDVETYDGYQLKWNDVKRVGNDARRANWKLGRGCRKIVV